MPFNLGFSELLIILLIVLLVFGAKRLPEMGAAMGKGIREFKRRLKDVQGSIEGDDEPVLPPTTRRIDAPGTPTAGEPKKLSQ